MQTTRKKKTTSTTLHISKDSGGVDWTVTLV
jgi:hypothetical protein